MKPLRFVALACIVVACSRDRSSNAADSLPADTTVHRVSNDSVAPPAAPDTTGTVPADSTRLASGQITVEQAVVNGVLWGASEDDARKTLGNPTSVAGPVWEEALGDSSTVLQYPGLSVRIVEKRVVGLHCTAQTCITGDAVRVGATRAEVEQAYGKAREEQGGSQLAYPFTTDDSCALRFEMRQGKVRSIDASCQMN